MEKVSVSTIVDDPVEKCALVVFTNGASCKVPYVQMVPGPRGDVGPTGPTGCPGHNGTSIDAIRIENNVLVYEVSDAGTGVKRELRAHFRAPE